MRHRALIGAASLALVVAIVAAQGNGVSGQASSAASTFQVPAATYSPPRTPWGDPDLQGLYDNINIVPMQRPDNLAGKKTYTDAEMAARNQRPGGNNDLCAPWKKNDDACKNASLARLDNVGGYNSFWSSLGWHVQDNRTALIEDPPDGRIPPLTPRAQAVKDAYLKERGPIALDTGTEDSFGRVTTYKHWLDFDILGRCIAAQVPTGAMPYNSARTIAQSPGFVMIALERVNTRVVPLDGRPHLGPNIRSWQGDSRGHWEGSTLVVETTNFTTKQSGGGVGSSVPPGIPFGNIRLVEHFVPVGPKRIEYYATLEDPTTWTRPWTFMQPWEKDPHILDTAGKSVPYQMYEYACREGDHGVENSLRGSKIADEVAAKQVALPASALVSSLIGATEASVQEKLGRPRDIVGPRWEYPTTDVGDVLWVFFEGGKVASVRPDNLPLDQVVRAR